MRTLPTICVHSCKVSQVSLHAAFAIRVPVNRLATRDPIGHAWRPASGPHRFLVARFAGDPDAVIEDVDMSR